MVRTPDSDRMKHGDLIMPGILLILAIAGWATFDRWVDVLVGRFPDRIEGIALLTRALVAVTWLVSAWFTVTAVNTYLWRGLLERRRGIPVPRLVTDISSGIITIVAVIGILTGAFHLSAMSVGAMFGGGVLLIGLFLRNPMVDLVSGLSLHMDPAINLGDTLVLPNGDAGRIEQISWRSTHLRTPSGDLILAPNHAIASAILTNFSRPTTVRRSRLLVTLDYSLPVDRALRILEAAARSASGMKGFEASPPPEVFIRDSAGYGLVYEIEFGFDASVLKLESARTHVFRLLMDHLWNAGVALAQPKQNVFLGRVRTRQLDWRQSDDRPELISDNPLFTNLRPDEIKLLANHLEIHEVAAGESVIRQNETDTSMFVLAEGLLEILIDDQSVGHPVKVAEIGPGSFFGEMSLLADEPRSATVRAVTDSLVCEIARDSLSKLLAERREIAETLGRAVVKRQFESSAKIADVSQAERDAAISDAAGSLVKRILSLFEGRSARKTGT